MNKTHIIIHHSLTVDGETVSWNAIRKYHMAHNGWLDIGYHFGVEKITDSHEVLMGRTPDSVGAHCKEFEMNHHGIGICFVGNFDKISPPLEQVKKGIELCNYLMSIYKIPETNVLGHGEVQRMVGVKNPKSCPGKLFDMNDFRRWLA